MTFRDIPRSVPDGDAQITDEELQIWEALNRGSCCDTAIVPDQHKASFVRGLQLDHYNLRQTVHVYGTSAQLTAFQIGGPFLGRVASVRTNSPGNVFRHRIWTGQGRAAWVLPDKSDDWEPFKTKLDKHDSIELDRGLLDLKMVAPYGERVSPIRIMGTYIHGLGPIRRGRKLAARPQAATIARELDSPGSFKPEQ